MSNRTPIPGGPWRLTLVTDPEDCNLSCEMCECGRARREAARAGPPPRMAEALALDALAALRGTPLREVIPSTMGEPLLWDGLEALIDHCAATGLALNLTTNGTWPGKGAHGWAARLAPVALDVKISWNGATATTAEAIMTGLDFEAAVDGAREFAAVRDEVAARRGHRCRLSFQVTAQERNAGELGALVRLARSLGVDRVKVNQLQERSPLLAGRALTGSIEGRRRWNLAVEAMRAAAAEAPLPSGLPILLENVAPLPLDLAAPAAGPCPFVGREAWLLHDGRFAPCPHPAAWRGELGDFGSVVSQPLSAIWAGEPLARLATSYQAHPICRTCPLRRPGGA